MSDEVERVRDALAQAGLETTDAVPGGPEKCRRCGLDCPETRFAACWPCAALEDPSEYDDAQCWEAIVDLASRGYSLLDWLHGRQAWGKLVPPEDHFNRLLRLRNERAPAYLDSMCKALGCVVTGRARS